MCTHSLQYSEAHQVLVEGLRGQDEAVPIAPEIPNVWDSD